MGLPAASPWGHGRDSRPGIVSLCPVSVLGGGGGAWLLADGGDIPRRATPHEHAVARSQGAKELRTLLTDRGIDTRDCLEKSDFARKVVETCANVTYYK